MKKKNIAQDKKIIDQNGFWYIQKNPISKVGVFPYLGRQINPSLEEDTVYQVYRPAEELFNEKTMDSFKLVPFTDEHTMLGTEEGMTPAEQKGIHGVTGEEIEHDADTLYSNLKVYSEELKKKIEDGKKEISLGYFCDYELTSGDYKGQHLDAVQRNISGNHMALVKQGRMGSSVRVMDDMEGININNNIKEKMFDKRKELNINNKNSNNSINIYNIYNSNIQNHCNDSNAKHKKENIFFKILKIIPLLFKLIKFFN